LKTQQKIISKTKKCFFFLLICFISFKGNAQQQKVADSIDASNSKSFISIYAWPEWHKIDSTWRITEYHKILDNFNLKLDCMQCSKVMMNVEMSIDGSGKLSKYRVVNSDKCGENFDKKLVEAFMHYFYTITFPPIFYNHKFTALLGSVLKC
jgi:hypothetical protein